MLGDDRFERVGFEDWRAMGGQAKGPSKVDLCAEEIRHLFMDGEDHRRPAIVEAMKEEGFGEATVDQALALLEDQPGIQRRHGERNVSIYRRGDAKPASTPSDQGVSQFPDFLREPRNWETEIGTDNAADEDDWPAQRQGF
jgi:hypothetical protein